MSAKVVAVDPESNKEKQKKDAEVLDNSNKGESGERSPECANSTIRAETSVVTTPPSKNASANDDIGNENDVSTPPDSERTPPSEAVNEFEEPHTPEAPETTVSLDKEEEVSDLEKSPPTDSESSKNKAYGGNSSVDDNISARADPDQVADDDSSNDDSSYFADPSNLPKPGSAQRRFSWSSSNNSVTRQQIQSAMSRESDASLSLSEDSDEDHHHRGHQSDSAIGYYHAFNTAPGTYTVPQQQSFQQQPIMGMYPKQQPHQFFMAQPDGVPELYPEQITRMHSVSSLVSESSQNSSASDKSVQDELQNVAVEKSPRTGSAVPSGRRSPILGEHPPSRGGGAGGGAGGGNTSNPIFASPSTVNPGPSPPTILQAPPHYPFAQQFGLPHPQPHHSMTPEELAAWAAAASRTAAPMQQPPPHHGSLLSTESAYSKESDLAYSGDSDTQHRQKQRSGIQDSSSGRSNRKADRRVRGGSRRHIAGQGGGGHDRALLPRDEHEEKGFRVYWQRWIMLFYMSILNLLSDWTCYSVAPIALLTEEAFGNINPEQLVVVFLCANGVSTACEPILLSRLGLRRTVLFGALLLMMGSIVKSGGMPPIIAADLKKGEGEWRVYLGFFLVGLSQPLYQCTPALLSASWFPERERTMATGVALNANQLGIGFAFIFGTILVYDSDDIPKYFGLLSIIATLTFLGTLIQFDDAPPTPPSETARVMRGTLEVNLPASMRSIFDSVRNIGASTSPFIGSDPQLKRSGSKTGLSKGDTRGRPSRESSAKDPNAKPATVSRSRSAASLSEDDSESKRSAGSQRRRSRRSQRGSSGAGSSGRRSSNSNARRRNVNTSKSSAVATDSGLGAGFQAKAPSPSPARWGPVSGGQPFPAPSPMMAGSNAPSEEQQERDDQQAGDPQPYQQQPPYATGGYPNMPIDEHGAPFNPYQNYPPQYQAPYWDPRFQQQAFFQQQQAQQYGYPMPPPDPYYNYYSYQHSLTPPQYYREYEPAQNFLPSAGVDEGVEPVLTLTPHHLDIDIRDDQVLLSTKACLARPGFIHSLVSFTVSGIVINTLSTFMDYLVRLNGAPRMYTGIVGGSFQFVIMISSLLIGRVCDKTRAYYSITVGMLVLGAFGLAECGVNLDADAGSSLRFSLVVVAALVGPLQPVSTELGVDVVYPLSENTVLVIQQLFSNLLSAAFIPCFKALKDYGAGAIEANGEERPQYTFSFYLLIVLHAAATVFFATFNGRYVRYEHELEKKAREEERKNASSLRAFHRIGQDQFNEQYLGVGPKSEQVPLMPPVV